MISGVRIRAFRAIEDIESSQKFIEGHRRVLDIFGIEKVTSSNNDWAYEPNVFVILVESLDGEKAYGGARIHAVDGIHPLPIEGATGSLDPNIYTLVKRLSKAGCGELCGLWNSREVAGLGVGSLFATRCGVAISKQIGLKYLFALCAPYTVKFAEWIGCKIETSLGNQGTFYYPKIDLLATVVLLTDTDKLEHANEAERNRILDLRTRPRQVYNEIIPTRRERSIDIHYEIQLNNIHPNEFKLTDKVL